MLLSESVKITDEEYALISDKVETLPDAIPEDLKSTTLKSFDANIIVQSAGTEASGKLNTKAVKAMAEIGLNISNHTSDSVVKYLGEEWDYVVTVCGGANETCPTFIGEVKNRLHIGFDDPSHAEGTEDFIWSEFIRVRDQIKEGFHRLYVEQIKPQL